MFFKNDESNDGSWLYLNSKLIHSACLAFGSASLFIASLLFTPNAQADSLFTYMERCEPYREIIEKILTEEGVSTDFYYLALAESGCRLDRKSPKGGAGLWQLMPYTAKSLGLKVNKSVDERLDIEKSTHAAARYIKKQINIFNDFEWAIAAYNAGGSNLKRIVHYQKGMKFNTIKDKSHDSWALAKTVKDFSKRGKEYLPEILSNPNTYRDVDSTDPNSSDKLLAESKPEENNNNEKTNTLSQRENTKTETHHNDENINIKSKQSTGSNQKSKRIPSQSNS